MPGGYAHVHIQALLPRPPVPAQLPNMAFHGKPTACRACTQDTLPLTPDQVKPGALPVKPFHDFLKLQQPLPASPLPRQSPPGPLLYPPHPQASAE